MSDDFFYLDGEEEEVQVKDEKLPWKVLIVDDEPEVHEVTRWTLRDFRFDDRRLDFISAHSGNEACNLIDAHPDAALVLLDVVMEEDDAGLKVVKHIRRQAKNANVRIVLRTGQPGQAPERQIIQDYDINDYKEKSELTVQKTVYGRLLCSAFLPRHQNH